MDDDDDSSRPSSSIQCHYDVLSVARDADIATIKKAHRKLALKCHPDKNPVGDEIAAAQFRIVQQAYECLSDASERKWYDEHRDAILKGWSSGINSSGEGGEILFDVVHFQHPGCYNGYGDDDGGFFAVYGMVFTKVYEGEHEGWISEGNIDDMPHPLPTDFGRGDTEWSMVADFYTAWESFSSCLTFAWADVYDYHTVNKEAPNRRVRRAMEEDNKKARRNARRTRNEEVLALVHFCKRRDPRVKAFRERREMERIEKERVQREEAQRKKAQAAQAREEWKLQAQEHMAQAEEQDKIAGRVRLADLEDEDDYYDYGGGKKRGKKGKRKNRNRTNNDKVNVTAQTKVEDESSSQQQQDEDDVDIEAPNDDENDVLNQDDDQDIGNDQDVSDMTGLIEHVEEDEIESGEYESTSEEESEPDVWRCECCRKDFKSEGQMQNHLKSKKHKEAWKKCEAKQRRKEKEESVMEDMLDELSF